jgi:hypothetical protein
MRSVESILLLPQEHPQMRATLTIEVDLLTETQKLAGIVEKAPLIREALKAPIERESAERLARLGGIHPNFKAPPRRRLT